MQRENAQSDKRKAENTDALDFPELGYSPYILRYSLIRDYREGVWFQTQAGPMG
jgi:hypothetical protein